jgi:hypothetical protein
VMFCFFLAVSAIFFVCLSRTYLACYTNYT